jgi:hypothetical protein
MTRSGAPVQGACGDGNTVTSAEVAQLPGAAAAGDGPLAKNSRRNLHVSSKHAVGAGAERRARSISI